jgi:outer membrane biosynthesis protein TonB
MSGSSTIKSWDREETMDITRTPYGQGQQTPGKKPDPQSKDAGKEVPEAKPKAKPKAEPKAEPKKEQKVKKKTSVSVGRVNQEKPPADSGCCSVFSSRKRKRRR